MKKPYRLFYGGFIALGFAALGLAPFSQTRAFASELCKNNYVFFDFGKTIIDDSKFKWGPTMDKCTGTFSYVPGAFEYLNELRTKGYKIGMLVNFPDQWGLDANGQPSTQVKIDNIKKIVAGDGHWDDPNPIQWDIFELGIFVPPRDENRKPKPYLFEQAEKLAKEAGCKAIYQGEELEEMKAARAAGMFPYQVARPGEEFFAPFLFLEQPHN